MISSAETVTVAIPTFNEESHIQACLDSVARQTYPHIIEVLVIDGLSTDRTREIASEAPGVTVIGNPRRLQAAALNIALASAKGEIFVRVDGHCVLQDDYVRRCVEALVGTGAAMVGGGMTPVAQGWLQEGIAAAMSSRLGAGPARFHVGGPSGWVDTVYLGAYRTALGRSVGGYAEDVGVNEDAEFAVRLRWHGGIWYDPSIRSTYTPRASLQALGRQFFRYGRSRAATVRRHPSSVASRQLMAPALLIGLASPWRRTVAAIYGAVVVGGAIVQARHSVSSVPGFVLALPTAHLSWGLGFLTGAAGMPPPRAMQQSRGSVA